MKWFKTTIIAALLIATPVLGSPPARYPVPNNLLVDIQPEEPGRFSKPVKVKIVFTSQIGTTRNVDASFYTSENLVVEPAKAKIDVLEEGVRQEIMVIVKSKGSKKGKGEKWVQVNYTQVPDYPRMIEWVKTNKNKYSSPDLAAKLIRNLKDYKDEGRAFRSSLTYDFQ
ncbi:MAG: hypothetical protein CSYNP_04340 [Syntrophus sp. SKADARSKE-3]|nr:hypothetical protein [Syntrophus sp. SKADARSKE-3]